MKTVVSLLILSLFVCVPSQLEARRFEHNNEKSHLDDRSKSKKREEAKEKKESREHHEGKERKDKNKDNKQHKENKKYTVKHHQKEVEDHSEAVRK